ncbi:MAG: S1C family serine protease [Candidatus Limnocylindrales bacterium]
MTDQRDAPSGAERPRPSRLGRVRARLRPLILFTVGVAATLIAISLLGVVAPGPLPLTSADVDAAIATALASQTPGPAFSELAYDAVRPSLVLIETEAAGSSRTPIATPTASGSAAPAGPAGSLGSGVVVDSAGDILTSLHVVADAAAIELIFADGTRSPGEITTREPTSDIAVVRATQPSANLVPATLGNPGTMHVGSDAYVVGNPFGLYGSMSAGVVSGLDRSFQLPNGGALLQGLIQVDAAVNPGNSGGPLLDRDGRVVGIITGLVNPTSQDVFIGIGFAVPINVAGGAAGLPQY